MENPSEQMKSVSASSFFEGVQEGSPIIKNILEGRAKIKFLSESLDTRKIVGRDWTGTAYLYEITVPDPLKPNEQWTKYFTTWSPTSAGREPYVKVPETQLTVLTRNGEMPLTENVETQEKILEQISKQVSEQK